MKFKIFDNYVTLGSPQEGEQPLSPTGLLLEVFPKF